MPTATRRQNMTNIKNKGIQIAAETWACNIYALPMHVRRNRQEREKETLEGQRYRDCST